MKTINEYKPESVTSPHECIEEIIEELNIKSKFLEDLVKNKTEIDRDIAEKIQKITKIPYHIFLNLQIFYNKHKKNTKTC